MLFAGEIHFLGGGVGFARTPGFSLIIASHDAIAAGSRLHEHRLLPAEVYGKHVAQ